MDKRQQGRNHFLEELELLGFRNGSKGSCYGAGKLMILVQLSSFNLRKALNGVGAMHPERGTGLGIEWAMPGQSR